MQPNAKPCFKLHLPSSLAIVQRRIHIRPAKITFQKLSENFYIDLFMDPKAPRHAIRASLKQGGEEFTKALINFLHPNHLSLAIRLQPS